MNSGCIKGQDLISLLETTLFWTVLAYVVF